MIGLGSDKKNIVSLAPPVMSLTAFTSFWKVLRHHQAVDIIHSQQVY